MSRETSYFDAPGKLIDLDNLRIPKACDMARTLRTGNLLFYDLLEFRCIKEPAAAEAIVFEVEVEVGQYPKNDIKRRERIAVVFREDDAFVPEVLSLRKDFPFVPHLNSLDSEEVPRSLCLYEDLYHEIKLTWTSMAFAERIREWLALTARGELHAEDQPLEPLLVGSLTSLVIPSDLFQRSIEDPAFLIVRAVESEGQLQALVASYARDEPQSRQGLQFVAASIVCKPQEHGVIRMTPTSLRQLHKLLRDSGTSFLGELRELLDLWRDTGRLERSIDIPFIIIVALPKTRMATSSVEVSDTWAFICNETTTKLADRLGVLLDDGDTELIGEDVNLTPLNVNHALSREMAAKLSGVGQRVNSKMVVIGTGALGSQTVSNLARMGYGEWTLIDNDQFLPHNLARHQLTNREVGRPKADALAEILNEMIFGEPMATSIVADILAPGKHAVAVEKAIASGDVILDTSASVAVARYLARDIDSTARRVSLFFNPSGTAGVMLCEDVERKSPSDWLEMLYYRKLVNDPRLRDHFRSPLEQVRYARSCRDLSTALPQELVALHAANGARKLRAALDVEDADIAIWKTNEEDLSIEHIRVEPSTMIEQHIGEWTVLTDRLVLDKVAEKRLDKLPNETGGVLIGTHDTQRRILYVVEALNSPLDSVEWPSLYIRGSRGVTHRVEEIELLTSGQLTYVGEWHSHPRNRSSAPSADDRKVFGWLKNHMTPAGLPATMLIVGEGESSYYVDRIS